MVQPSFDSLGWAGETMSHVKFKLTGLSPSLVFKETECFLPRHSYLVVYYGEDQDNRLVEEESFELLTNSWRLKNLIIYSL